MHRLLCDKSEMIPSALEFTVLTPPPLDFSSPHMLTPWRASGGVCVRQTLQFDSGYCFLIGAGLNSTCAAAVGWVLQEGGGMLNNRSAGRIIACGALPSLRLASWHTISLAVSPSNQSALEVTEQESSTLSLTMIGTVDDIAVVDHSEQEPVRWRQGMVSLRSGFHYSLFDDLSIV